MTDKSPALNTMAKEYCAILDFGSQYSQLIARRVRENRVYCEIVPHDISAADLRDLSIKGIILSGGPCGVYDNDAPQIDPEIFDLGVPILGICYGMQIGCQTLGGEVKPAEEREYGSTTLFIDASEDPLFHGLPDKLDVWMSHGDRVVEVGTGIEALAHSQNSPLAAVREPNKKFYGLQFHPEVTHTRDENKIINNFLYRICKYSGDWEIGDYVEKTIAEVREQVGETGRVICALSGGVDSSVVAALLHKAVGDRLSCFFIDNGLLREGEAEQVTRTFSEDYSMNFRCIDATDRFLSELEGVTEPEKKRIKIGHQFIEEFRTAAEGIENAHFLAQGTLYPDVIESLHPNKGPSATIKTHHNVGGLPDDLNFELIEPLRYLFKDEARAMGRRLGLPDEIVSRQPFPGPGLGIRILGEVTPDRLAILRKADHIVQEEIRAYEDYKDIWQSFAVLLPINTVGVQGDKRTYEHVIALRIVESTDGMTADWMYLPQEILHKISSRICNEVSGVNRVTLDISSKPPSTIEWE